MERMNDNEIIDLYINKVVDERTITAKNNFKNARHVAINTAHAATSKLKQKHELLQQGKNVGYALSTTVRRLVNKFKRNNQQVGFSSNTTVARFYKRDDIKMVTYDSGTDHHYMS